MNLLVAVTSDALTEYAYDAELAGLRFQLASQPEGVQVGARSPSAWTRGGVLEL